MLESNKARKKKKPKDQKKTKKVVTLDSLRLTSLLPAMFMSMMVVFFALNMNMNISIR